MNDAAQAEPAVSAIVRSPASSPRRRLARDLIAVQIKLIVGGLADVVLAPLTLITGIAGLVLGPGSERLFYTVLRLGRSFEQWVGLYRAADREHDREPPGDGLDGMLSELQRTILEKDLGTGDAARARRKLTELLTRLDRRS